VAPSRGGRGGLAAPRTSHSDLEGKQRQGHEKDKNKQLNIIDDAHPDCLPELRNATDLDGPSRRGTVTAIGEGPQ